ncbi:transmembrane protein 51b [Trichomycterus rosablanca]|uniref:transmembrane protein 51b n=1 Tax=Trichomycterus rosablanca TaxID=2290929 RepID=UPI002F358495
MCSSGQRLCSGSRPSRPRSSSSHGNSSSSQYALCALGVGLVALGVVMIVWTVVPLEGRRNNTGTQQGGITSNEMKQKTSSVAFVLVGAGLAMLLLAVCLGLRDKHRRRTSGMTTTAGVQYTDNVQGEPVEIDTPAPTYDVPSYDEAVTSGRYPISQSNLRRNSSQLPSYEDLIAAVENEGNGPGAGRGQNTSRDQNTPLAASTNPQPARSSSRASRILRPLRVRRIKSEKLHVKDIRLNIQSPSQEGRVTIEPLTPPPQYEDKVPEFPVEPV